LKNRFKRIIKSVLPLVLAGMVMGTNAITAIADAPYKTYTVDGYGSITETQTAYLPYETITKIGEETLVTPTDFCLVNDEFIYILDSGNKRVVVSDLNSELVTTFGEGTLVGPKGIYVTSDRITYVADRDAGAIFVFDKEGQLTQTYTKPKEAMYGETLDFLPLKVVVNKSGTIYAVCESNTNGIVQISPVEGGTFLGYFGTNATKAGIWNIIWRALLTDAQRAKMQSNIPSTPDNMAIDDKGVIYTITRGEKNDTLKRLNIAGVNMTKTSDYPDIPVAVASGNHDNAFVVTQTGFIYEYNNEGDLLFMFGGSDDGKQRIGLSTKAEAIQIGLDDKIYVLDSEKAQIQVFEPTEFTAYLHNALYLFSKGRYEESKEPLNKVLEMNNLFTYANMAMGKALYKEGDYKGALEYARIAKDKESYSDAFWEIRNVWLKKNLTWIAIVILVIVACVTVVKLLDKKKHILDKPKAALKKAGDHKLTRELGYMFYFMRHPIDGCYGIKREGRVSVLSANIILAIGTVFFIVSKYFSGFLTKTVREGKFDVISDIGMILIGLLLIVSCNYLMCTINDGEGKFKHIYCAFIYAFGPYLILSPVVFIFSHIVSNNEIFFVHFGRFCMWVWIAVLIYIGVQEINNYTVGETVKIILLTVFTILIVSLLAFIIYVLWSQVFDFLQSIFGEVVYRIGS
jgi:sugar lactone lactonase YvrE